MTFKTKEGIVYLLQQNENMEFDIEPHKEKKKRSLNANGYLWILCEKIAQEISKDGTITTKEDIYKEAIRNVGVFTPIVITEVAFNSFKSLWEGQGLGAQISEVSHKNKCVRCNCYFGSSTYNVSEMSRLIDFIVQECQQLNIETKSAEEIKSMIGEKNERI